jgi:hypothetical protein
MLNDRLRHELTDAIVQSAVNYKIRAKIVKAAKDFILSVAGDLNWSRDPTQFGNCSNDGLQLSSTMKLNVVLPVNTYFCITPQSPIKKEGMEYGQLSAADKKIVDQCVSDSR